MFGKICVSWSQNLSTSWVIRWSLENGKGRVGQEEEICKLQRHNHQLLSI